MFKNKPIIILITILLCTVIILLAHFQFFNARESTIRLYSEKQTVLANQVALSIEKFFYERISALELLGADIVVRHKDQDRYTAYFENVYKKIGSFEYIIYMNQHAEIVTAYPESPAIDEAGFDHARELIRTKYKAGTEKQNSVICTHNLIYSEENWICIRVPVYDVSDRFLGLVVGVISLETSLNNLLAPTIEQEGAHTFILSRMGDVLFHPVHPEMVRNNIKNVSDTCIKCHDNFSLEERMLVEKSGWGEKRNSAGDRRLLSFSAIHLPGVSWSVGIDMPYRRITEANSTQFQVFFLLSALMMLVVILGSIALYRINKEKILIEKRNELNRRDHLAFIGEMSTRIAHEIKNPLASLQAGIQLLESNLPQDEKTTEYFKKLTSEVERVDRIVKGLLSYAREEQLHKKKTDLVPLIEKVVTLNKHAVKDKHIDWKIESADNSAEAKIDPQKIEQVFWNLILNSVQAIKGDGHIIISIGNHSNTMVQCTISDSGAGISDDVQKKIFRPFYSTKSQGTGLGLAISKKIITAHGGEIDIKSKSGEGTTVNITLPR
jgi:signal transduction histidine kinase